MKNLIQKCDCCDAIVSRVYTPFVNISFKEKLIIEMIYTLTENGVKGNISLICTEDFVIGFQYEYRTKKEQKLAGYICNDLTDLCEVLSKSQITNDDIILYSADLREFADQAA